MIFFKEHQIRHFKKRVSSVGINIVPFRVTKENTGV